MAVNRKQIYLSGAMSNISLEKQCKWRSYFSYEIKNADFNTSVICFDPTKKYNVAVKEHKTEKEPFEYDLYQLRKSDIVVVNFNDGGKSIGTAMELMLAHELDIPVIGINEDNVELHPWLQTCVWRMCESIDEAIDHVISYYLT